MPYPSPEILARWLDMLRSRPRPTRRVVGFPPDAPRATPNLGDIPAARIWDKMRGAGANIERGAGWGDVDWQALIDAGVCWVRLFFPYRPDFEMNGPGSAAPPSDAQLHQLVMGAERAVQAGIKVVLIDCTDVLDVQPAYQHADTIEDVVRRLARLIKASSTLSIENCAYGPVNEFAGADSDDEWKGFRDRMNAACREELPEHCLVSGIYYWKYSGYIIDQADPCPFGDPNWLVDCHTYEQLDWTWYADQLQAWMFDKQRLVVTGEIGPYNPNWQWLDIDEWEQAYRAQAPLWPISPLAPWAVTYGSALRLNYWENLQLDDMHVGWMRDMAAGQATRPPLADGGTPPEPAADFTAELTRRTDYELTVALTAPGACKVAVVESSPPYAWRGPPRTVQPGSVEVTLTHWTDFAKFVSGSEDIDVPTPEEAAAYTPSDGGNGGNGGNGEYTQQDLQAAHDAGFAAGFAQALQQIENELDEKLEGFRPGTPPPYVPP